MRDEPALSNLHSPGSKLKEAATEVAAEANIIPTALLQRQCLEFVDFRSFIGEAIEIIKQRPFRITRYTICDERFNALEKRDWNQQRAEAQQASAATLPGRLRQHPVTRQAKTFVHPLLRTHNS